MRRYASKMKMRHIYHHRRRHSNHLDVGGDLRGDLPIRRRDSATEPHEIKTQLRTLAMDMIPLRSFLPSSNSTDRRQEVGPSKSRVKGLVQTSDEGKLAVILLIAPR